MTRALVLGAALALALACSRPRPTPVPGDGVAPSDSAGAVDASAAGEPPLPEGARRVRSDTVRFPSAASAAAWLGAFDVSVLAIGESHAPRGAPKVPSATARFTSEILPVLAPGARDLLVELWASDPKCRATVAKVAAAQKVVTSEQRAENPSEFVALGVRAKELGVTPYLLRPSCDDYAEVADAGDDDVAVMLELVARVTAKDLLRFAARARDGGARTRVVAYGGSMHNDRVPRPELARYSFGPAVEAELAGRYLEIDLVVPEFVAEGPAWEKLPFYARFREDGAPASGVVVYRAHERAYTLVFARSEADGGSARGP